MKTKQNKDVIIKARVQGRTKASIQRLADSMDLNESTIIRLAISQFIDRNRPHAA